MEERRQEIIRLLNESGSMKVQDLIDRFDASPATVRRDLVYLEKNGLIIKTRGHVRIVKDEPLARKHFSEAKVAIGKAAAELIEDGSTVLVDSGSTALACAYQLIGKKNLTIVTNSIAVVNALANVDIEVNVTGGYLNGREEALLGPDAERFVESIKVKYCILATTGTRIPSGLTCVTPFQANIKRKMVQAAEKVILVADAEKFQVDALIQFAGFADLDYIVTNQPLNNAPFEKYLKEKEVEVIIAS